MNAHDEAERAGILRLCHQAGVQQHEMWDHPEHGLCVSLSGLRKMAEFAPDQRKARELVKQMEMLAGPGKDGLQ